MELPVLFTLIVTVVVSTIHGNIAYPAKAAFDAANYAQRPAASPPTPCPDALGCDKIDNAGLNAGPSIRIWPGAAPDERQGFPTAVENGHCLGEGTFETCVDRGLSDVSVPTLTPFLVPNADSAMVIAPGGAYVGLAINREGTDIATWLNGIGVSAFVLKYRVPARPWTSFGAAPLQDAQRAMGLVRQMAMSGKLKGLNASKIGFMGFSAGSHLTGHLNVAWKNRTYTRVDAADDISCRPSQSIMVYPWESVSNPPVNATNDKASANNVTQDTPPTMVIQAEDDPVHMENALFYYYALKTQGAAASELHIYPKGGHGYGRCTVNAGAAAAYHEVCTWPDRGRLFLQTLGAAPKNLTKG